jgi:hypothetical protein
MFAGMAWSARRLGGIVALAGLSSFAGQGCLFPSLDELVCEANCGGGGASPCALRPGMRGTEGILVTPPLGPAFCIEPTEVTVAQYYELYESASFPLSPDPTPPDCGPETNPVTIPTNTRDWFAPSPTTVSYYANNPQERDRPIQGIHWCQAQAYCVWAGKHLCRAGDGLSRIDHEVEGWNLSTQWYYACRGAADLAYGYAQSYASGVCNDDNPTPDNNAETSPVTQPAGCVSTWPSGVIFNMSGNVQEFEDNCDPVSGLCVMRGGALSLRDEGDLLTCAGPSSPKADWHRMTRLDLTGIRCCYDPAQ